MLSAIIGSYPRPQGYDVSLGGRLFKTEAFNCQTVGVNHGRTEAWQNFSSGPR